MVCLENSDNTQPKKSKKKKEKRNLSLNGDQSNEISKKQEKICENGTGTQDESRKSKKKKRMVTEPLHSSQTGISKVETMSGPTENLEHCEVGGLTGKSKKKKKKCGSECLNGSQTNQTVATKENSSEKFEGIGKSVKESKESQKSKKKKRKIKEQSNHLQRDDHEDIEPKSDDNATQESSKLSANSGNDPATSVPQNLCDSNKKKKSKRRQKEECLDNAALEVSTSEPPVKPKKSKKRKKMDDDAGVNGEAQELTESCNMLPTKKRKKQTSVEEDNVQSKENMSKDDKPSEVKKKKSKNVIEANENLPTDTKEEILEVVDNEPPINAAHENEATVTKKRKKKSKNKEKGSSNQLPDSNSSEQKVKRKKKKTNSASSPVSNDHVSDINKEHPATETTSNKELEPENHKKTKPAEDVQNVDTDIANQAAHDDLGQWKTAELSSSAHEKFARLLGARKKRYKPVVTPLSDLKAGESVLSKLSGVWKPPPERTLFGSLLNRDKKFAKMAMDQTETAKLNESLETQYNKTLEFNLQKRKEGNTAKGLGFQEDPAKGKKHYIDIHKVKSIELD